MIASVIVGMKKSAYLIPSPSVDASGVVHEDGCIGEIGSVPIGDAILGVIGIGRWCGMSERWRVRPQRVKLSASSSIVVLLSFCASAGASII